MSVRTDIIIKLLQFPKVGRKVAFKILDDIQFDITSDFDLFDLLKEKSAILDLPKFDIKDLDDALAKAEKILEKSEKENVHFISWYQHEYPKELKRIGKDKAPIVLNVKGDKNLLHEKQGVAIIGTRKPTEYGSKIGKRLGQIFGEAGFNVISGLAIGCDTAGHQGCLEAGGKTTAILAEGLNRIYPKENKPLAEEILDKGGLLVSEYFIGQGGFPSFFVERDRIQAALSECVIVVETDIKGGTMHTVNYTLDFKRILAAFDHPSNYRTDCSRGNQKLIQERKATPLTSEADIQMLIERIKSLNTNESVSEPIKQDIPKKAQKEKKQKPPELFDEGKE